MKLKATVLLISLLAGVTLLSSVNSAALNNSPSPDAAVTAEQHHEAGEDEHGAHAAGHGDPFARAFEVFAIILICAVLGRYGARKLNQSPVLGELMIGIIVGAIIYELGGPGIIIIRHNDLVQDLANKVLAENIVYDQAVHETLEESGLPRDDVKRIEQILLSDNFRTYTKLSNSILLFSSLGVILLLFMVGLESSVSEMKEVGGSASGVAIIGVVAPFALGYLTTILLFPEGTDPNVPIFVGATLCATSIGITARVFKDMNKLGMGEAKIVLGAAVLDDVLGLIVLAIVTGIVTTGSVEFTSIGAIFLKASLFLGAVVFFGMKFLRSHVRFFAMLDQSNVKLIYPFALLMILAWLADLIGLATIVGAFAAGLIIEEEHFQMEKSSPQSRETVESIMAPLEGIFAPVFFVLMGIQVDVGTFLEMQVLLAGLALTAVAIISKVAASVIVKKGNDKFIVGFGMIPRGEVGLIFASIGKSLGVLDSNMFSVIIIVVLLTTLVTPPLLQWAIERKEKESLSG